MQTEEAVRSLPVLVEQTTLGELVARPRNAALRVVFARLHAVTALVVRHQLAVAHTAFGIDLPIDHALVLGRAEVEDLRGSLQFLGGEESGGDHRAVEAAVLSLSEPFDPLVVDAMDGVRCW